MQGRLSNAAIRFFYMYITKIKETHTAKHILRSKRYCEMCKHTKEFQMKNFKVIKNNNKDNSAIRK